MSTATSKSRAPRPVPSGVEYHRVLAGDKRRIGRGILAIVLLLGGLFGAIQLFYTIGVWIDGLVRSQEVSASQPLSPVTFASALAATALLIPWSMLIQRWLYGIRGLSLHSVLSRFRFDLFGRALLAITPVLLIALAITEYLEPRGTTVWSHVDIIGWFVVIVLLVPLQAAGEEYGLRGLVFRIAGSWVHGRWASLALGIVVSSALFAVIHAAGDLWWNVLYVVMSVVTALITWRTGGIEIAVTLHAVFNVFTLLLWLVLGADLAERFDRSAGTVTPALFIPSCLALILIAVVVWMRTRRDGPPTTPSLEPSTGAAEVRPSAAAA